MDCYAITLPERLELVTKLANDILMPINIFNAIKGNLNNYKAFKHILSNEKITAGMIGCLESHIEILKNANRNIIIFEDDCEFVSDSKEFTPDDFDILCLGTNENVEFQYIEGKDYLRVYRFWGTHALLIRFNAIEAILNTYEKYRNQKIFLPADWLYSYAIKEHNLKAYAPINPKQYFKQKSGLVSTINGKIRN
jgi:GR25 family glycosyltransferase involved in LPS biosynthesis